MRAALAAALALALAPAAACGSDIDAGGDGSDAGPGDDPLDVGSPAAPGSLEEIQRVVIQERCSGEPGLCHNGQFEPNLSTTANTYAYLVNRPAIESATRLRVDPGDPDSSFLIDKLRNRNGVATQMPLGAEPLSEDRIAMFEDWIAGGALRAPGADPAPVLNNPPEVPELGIFDGAQRIDGPGTVTIAPNTTLTFRHSVEDFETPDDQMFIAGLVLSTPMGNVLMSAPAGDFKPTAFDAANPPMGNGDVLDYFVDFTIGDTIDLVNKEDDSVTNVPTAGLTLTPIVLYLDEDPSAGGIVAVRLPDSSLMVQP